MPPRVSSIKKTEIRQERGQRWEIERLQDEIRKPMEPVEKK